MRRYRAVTLLLVVPLLTGCSLLRLGGSPPVSVGGPDELGPLTGRWEGTIIPDDPNDPYWGDYEGDLFLTLVLVQLAGGSISGELDISFVHDVHGLRHYPASAIGSGVDSAVILYVDRIIATGPAFEFAGTVAGNTITGTIRPATETGSVIATWEVTRVE